METREELKKFTEAFFKNIKCNLQWKGDLLQVSLAPQAFEEFFGKKSPYTISFEQGIENTELIAKGSFLLKAMIKYLGDRAQTTLIKLDFDRDYKKELEHHFKLRNCELYKLDKKVNHNSILRFTFTTTLQYMNEREQLLNDLYIKDGKVSPFNLEKFKYLQGKENEAPKQDLKTSYAAAKDALKAIILPRIQETSEVLKVKLEKETQRIREHYKQQRKELENSLNRLLEQKKSTQEEIIKTGNKELQQKIIKIDESIAHLRAPEKEKQLTQEEKFFINDEMHKLSLNIDNKLMNTTIIYYPVYTFSMFLKSADAGRQKEITFDPLQDTITPILCETCERDIQEILICSSGHIVCHNCHRPCIECGKGLCNKCIKRQCETCTRRLCKRCANQCTSCLKYVCKTHMRKDYATGKDCCLSCLQQCSLCLQSTTSKHMKKDISGRPICEKCVRLASLKRR